MGIYPLRIETMKTVSIVSAKLAYKLFGVNPKTCIVIETAMMASCAEWWHLAEHFSKKYSVLVYDRAGYGLSSRSTLSRTPENIACELHELISKFNFDGIILIGHSIGGLYAYQYYLMFPEKIKSLILIDPVSPNNKRFQNELSKEEYRKSGVDKVKNLKVGLFLSSIGIGRLLKGLLKKSPPFYYFNNFSKEAESYILNHLTQRKTYKVALEEYFNIPDTIDANSLKTISDIPLYLVCHSSEVMRKEIEYYGNTDNKTSE